MANWREEVKDALGDVTKEFVVMSFWLIAIFALGGLNKLLSPPDGMVMFEDTAYAFPLKWLVEAGEVANVGLFLLRSVYKVATRSWR
jgi:hypothetical protein